MINKTIESCGDSLLIVIIVSGSVSKNRVGERELQACHLNLEQLCNAILLFHFIEEILGSGRCGVRHLASASISQKVKDSGCLYLKNNMHNLREEKSANHI
jgi:hypothetical protein